MWSVPINALLGLDGPVSTIDGMSFHKNCYTCAKCNLLLFDKITHVIDLKTYCDRCGQNEQLNELPQCFECKQPLVGDWFVVSAITNSFL